METAKVFVAAKPVVLGWSVGNDDLAITFSNIVKMGDGQISPEVFLVSERLGTSFSLVKQEPIIIIL